MAVPRLPDPRVDGDLAPTQPASRAPTLRDYQRDFIAACHAARRAGHRRVMGVAPTGSGKAVLLAHLAAAAVAQDQCVLVLVHRRELLKQAARKLYDAGIDAGTIAAGFPARPGRPVQVAMVPTLNARAMNSRTMALPAADLVLVDEAHHATATTWSRLIEAYPDADLVGFTATPVRRDGRGLGALFERLVECPQVDALIADGFLVGTKMFSVEGPDLSGVATSKGDYVVAQLEQRVDRAELVGDVVSHWLRHAHGRRTIVFATTVAHSTHLRDAFSRNGVVAEHLDGKTPAEARDAILARLASGSTEVVCNCAVLTEGFDLPDLECIVLARPTRSLGLYRQMVGRGLRPAPGKDHCVVLDHAGALLRHGFIEEPIIWSLDPDTHARNERHESRGQYQRALVDCPECGAARFQGQPCPACGWRPQPKPEPVQHVEADLVLHQRGEAHRPSEVSEEERRAVYSQFRGLIEEMNRWRRAKGVAEVKPAYAAVLFRNRFGSFPPWAWRHDATRAPERWLRSWVRGRQSAYRRRLIAEGVGR